MKFIKIKISLQERIRGVFHAIEWLAITTIPAHGLDGKWYESTLDFKERWECFLSSLETAIIGYVYGLEPTKSSEYTPLKYKIKPYPYQFCSQCMMNGNYPWNRNPLLLCSGMGGLAPMVIFKGDEAFNCGQFKLVDGVIWKSHLEDLKKEAIHNDMMRLKAMKSECWSSELLPAEEVCSKKKGV